MRKLFFFLIVVASLGMSSCRVFNPSTMMQTPKDYEYAQFKDSATSEYVIQSHDILRFRLFANDGFKIIDLSSSAQQAGGSAQQTLVEYAVEHDGKCKLPIIGRVQLADLTLREAELFLEKQYDLFYVKPFVQLRVINRRVLIFTGSQSFGLLNTGGGGGFGGASVIRLENEATTLIEVLAKAGGISGNGKAWKIKLIRGDLKDPEVFLIDLSTLEGIQAANLYVEAGDMIYVEPSFAVSGQILSSFTQVLGIVSTTILTIVLSRQL